MTPAAKADSATANSGSQGTPARWTLESDLTTNSPIPAGEVKAKIQKLNAGIWSDWGFDNEPVTGGTIIVVSPTKRSVQWKGEWFSQLPVGTYRVQWKYPTGSPPNITMKTLNSTTVTSP